MLPQPAGDPVPEGPDVISPDQLEEIEVMEEEGVEDRPPFIRVRRIRLRHRYSGGRFSSPYLFDVLEGPFADAVAVLVYYLGRDEKIWVGLRRGVRPSIYLRRNNRAKAALDGTPRLLYYEIVAGGIEYGDLDGLGIDGRAAREVKEEAGFQVRAEDVFRLGEGTFSSPGFGMEKIHYRAVRVDPGQGGPPQGDGHPLEEVGEFQFYELTEALAWCRSGVIQDSKTEIGLYRLANYLGYLPELGQWRRELPVELQGCFRPLGLGPEQGD
ncbi:MAG TPA: NUDIX hydrolase [Syntrophobacteria bacterium]|nr:NUDIX hydrolase [Syntrophobacteria bacterium]